jgi:hypothetical protein
MCSEVRTGGSDWDAAGSRFPQRAPHSAAIVVGMYLPLRRIQGPGTCTETQ